MLSSVPGISDPLWKAKFKIFKFRRLRKSVDQRTKAHTGRKFFVRRLGDDRLWFPMIFPLAQVVHDTGLGHLKLKGKPTSQDFAGRDLEL